MPVFDFNNSPQDSKVPECTYKVFYTNCPESSPEHPILILDNKAGKLVHHSNGIFTNPIRRTAFEFKGEEGTVSEDILEIDARFVSLLKWLGENHINVRLSGAVKEEKYAVYKIREIAFGGGAKLSAEDGFLQFMIERLLSSDAPSRELPDEDEEETGDSMKLTVSVSLPIGMGNEYQDAEAYIDWIFYAKQYTSPDDGGGDDDTYTVTVNYYDMDGNELRSSYVRSYAEGTRYNVESVIYETLRSGGESYVLMSIEGDEIEGYMNDDRVIDLYYSLDEDIDDGDTPLEELPDIDDGNNPPDITDIDENLPPLSDLPDTGDNGMIYSAVAMVLSGTALAALLLFAPRKKNEAE